MEFPDGMSNATRLDYPGTDNGEAFNSKKPRFHLPT
jgi:hypothetical protein